MKKADVLWNTILFFSLTIYFMVMKVMGLHTVLGLRFANLAFHFAIVYMAMRRFRAHADGPLEFWDTTVAGIRACVPAVVLFGFFQYLNLRVFDPGFMAYIQDNAPMGAFLSPPLVAVALIAEGLVGTFFSAYIGMRLIAVQEKAKFPTL
jgi:hypothetical protein